MKENEKSIVLFPNLSVRLREKGFAALHENQYQEALQFFDQLCMYELQDEHSEFAAVVCLMELNEWKEAKVRCEELIGASEELRIDAEDMFITILVQLHDYRSVVKLVEQLVEEKALSEERKQKLAALYSFAQKMLQEETYLTDQSELTAVFEGKDIAKQLQALQLLREQGAVGAFPFLRSFLQQKDQHPYIKSLIVHMLMEYEVDEEITVSKYGRSVTITPSKLLSEQESPFSQAVLRQLEDIMEHDNPTMFQAVEEYWHQMLVILFPLQPIPEKISVWAAALQKIGEERFYMRCDDEEVAERYGVMKEELLAAYDSLLVMEKDGYLTV